MDNRTLGDPGSASFQLDKYPFFQLNRLVSRYNIVIEARLRSIGLDIPYWRVLMTLGEHSPRGVRDIAEAAIIPLSTMTRIVQRMTAAGLVTTQPSALDARVTEVELTELGRERLADAREAAAPIYAQIIRGIDEADFAKLLDLLGRLQSNLI
ncbi:MAG: MarR family transcriptional regulator [Sphingobium sp.]|nr:MAG: MarR family transcriptional regulator [Sphingobium sp.]